jgi:hypothetical protein
VLGPNGYRRRITRDLNRLASARAPHPEIRVGYAGASGNLHLKLRNHGGGRLRFTVKSNPVHGPLSGKRCQQRSRPWPRRRGRQQPGPRPRSRHRYHVDGHGTRRRPGRTALEARLDRPLARLRRRRRQRHAFLAPRRRLRPMPPRRHALRRMSSLARARPRTAVRRRPRPRAIRLKRPPRAAQTSEG